MTTILLGQSYYLRFDPKLWEAMQPYPPLGTLYAASWLRQHGYDVALFDAMLAESEEEWARSLDEHKPKYAIIYEDNFNYLSKMCLLRMREAAFKMIHMAKSRGCVVILCGADATDHFKEYLERGADYCILGEPTNMMLIPRHCGTTWFKITVPGTLIHTAWSNYERNAVSSAALVLDALNAWIPGYMERNQFGGTRPKVNIAAIEGGWPWRGARTPDDCCIYLDVRTLPDVLPVQAYNEVRQLVRGVVSKHPALTGTTVDIYVSAPGTSIPDDHALIKTIVGAHTEQLGKAPEFGMETWYSDAAHMNRYGIPTVNYGSAGRFRSGGAGFSTHQGEHVHIGDMVDMTRIYVRCILEICGVAA